MKKVTMRELAGKDIRITDFTITEFMKSKKDKARVELEVDGEYCYFETTSLEVLYQLSWIKDCVMAYTLKSNTNKIRFVKMLDTANPSYNGSRYEKLISKEFGNDDGTTENNTFILLPDNPYSRENDNNQYFCFYKNSVYAKVIKVKNSIYFSFNVSKETIDSIIKNENAAYTKKVEKIIKEKKSDSKTN